MQSTAGPGQPVISSCQREAESTRNLGGMGGGEGGTTGGGATDRTSSVSTTIGVYLKIAESETFMRLPSLQEFLIFLINNNILKLRCLKGILQRVVGSD